MTRDRFISIIESRQRTFRRFFVALCCGDGQLADDLTQETIIKAYLSLESLNNDERFNSWFYKIGYRIFLNNNRSHRPVIPIEDMPDQSDPNLADDSFRYQNLYRALDLLSPSERTSIILFYMEGYSIKEIAGIEGCSVDYVKQHLSRGRKHLRDILK